MTPVPKRLSKKSIERLPAVFLRVAMCCVLALCLHASPRSQRLRLAPQFTPGETLRYQVDLRTRISGQGAGPIVNPEAPTKLQISIGAIVRLEVLAVQSAARQSPGPSTRLRATYEKASARVESNSFDPQATKLEQQYQRLQGRSIEFTLDGDGRLSDVRGLADLLPDARAADSISQWLSGFALASALPRRGIAIGDKWSAEQPVKPVPLEGLVLRTHSTYLRNDACPAPALPKQAQAGGAAGGGMCAVIVTDSETVRRHARHDPTPPEYRAQGLHTLGRWSSSGESLSYISLRTGLLVNLAGTGQQDMDVTIASDASTSRVRYTGQTRSDSQVTLLPESQSEAK